MNEKQGQKRDTWKKKSLFLEKRDGKKKSRKIKINGPPPPCRHVSHPPGDSDTAFQLHYATWDV